jgi:hypothetical protein
VAVKVATIRNETEMFHPVRVFILTNFTELSPPEKLPVVQLPKHKQQTRALVSCLAYSCFKI